MQGDQIFFNWFYELVWLGLIVCESGERCIQMGYLFSSKVGKINFVGFEVNNNGRVKFKLIYFFVFINGNSVVIVCVIMLVCDVFICWWCYCVSLYGINIGYDGCVD